MNTVDRGILFSINISENLDLLGCGTVIYRVAPNILNIEGITVVQYYAA
jgi:hypothetical protein